MRHTHRLGRIERLRIIEDALTCAIQASRLVAKPFWHLLQGPKYGLGDGLLRLGQKPESWPIKPNLRTPPNDPEIKANEWLVLLTQQIDFWTT